MKKWIGVTVVLAALLLSGCGKGSASAEKSSSASKGASGAISVISREDGSGTRGAFTELFGVETKKDGKKVDQTTDQAEITNSTSVMMTTVAGNQQAIGYISLGSLNKTVKALKIDGVAPSKETVKDGTYKISRPFNIVQKSTDNPVAQDFIKFILSDDGQKVVEDNGYISKEKTGAFTSEKPQGKIVVAGSSSVTPVMEKLKEAYLKLNSGADIDIQQSDSTTGISSAKQGIADIGMASRELQDSEKDLKATVIAQDGIAVIVNKKQTIDQLSSDTVKKIYTGKITDWSEAK